MLQHECSPGPDSQESSPISPVFSTYNAGHQSDIESVATTVPETVMAEQVTKDVVKEAQSVGRPAPVDDTASTTKTLAAHGELPSGPTTTNATTSEPASNATNATSADAAPADGARAPGKADGAATETTDGTEKPLLNGDSGENAVADASGGSDTDISRPGSVDQSKRDAGHVRTNSMKKPSTFKSVSVTKNFLAKSVTSTPTARPGEKAAPAAPSASAAAPALKPRLVAKLGTGNAPRTLGKVNGAGSGPDASKVWNKNQPVPPPPPKQFTDEELKQQYGIHLATRLQADEAGKEAKWADIDDDEDDWAPDTVQWMDGTKSSGAAAENEPPAVEEPKPVQKAPETAPEPPKPTPAAATNTPKPSVTGGPKTILKPGAHAQPAGGKSSLVLKGQPEKPTLVSKPSASEKKSPWAVLPPVEKVSPVAINPPAQQAPPRFSQRDSYGYDPMPPLPAKEIAPDDFNRSWRDDTRTRPELFNSQSGRYEPVNDVRRGSVRDPGFRQQPAVLQRPSQDGPAEPSAAFQQSRSGGDAPNWGGGRRRNSSNVSGGRRMSIDRRQPEMPTGPVGIERRGSHSVNGVDPSSSGVSRHPSVAQAISPNVAHAHPASPFGSVASSGAHELPTPTTAPTAPAAEDPVEVQKKLMADKIERARLKKQQEREAEEKEEAERKERLAKRLAAMGPAKVKAQVPDQVPEKSPKKASAAPAAVQSPPKPPVPTTDGEIAQYGMMKVHHAQPVKKTSMVEDSLPTPAPTAAAASPSSSKAQTASQTRQSHSLAQQPTKSFDSLTRENENSRQPGEQPIGTVQSEGAVPAGPRPQQSQAGWQSGAAPQPRPWTSQVWGAPSAKDRALGNGTFGSGYDRSQPRAAPQQLPVQPPLGPTTDTSRALAPGFPTSQSASATPAQVPHSQAGSMAAQVASVSRPGPIAAPPTDNRWNNFKALISQDDRDHVAKAQQDRERIGDAFRPEMRETYKNPLGQSQTTMHEKVGGNRALPNGVAKDDAVKVAHEAPSSQQTLGSATTLQPATGPRASRFFPRSTEPAAQPFVPVSTKAESPPPPPETESHPAFGSSTGHPLVRLPRPSPVVRLPRPAVGGAVQADAPVSMPPRGTPGLGARPLAMNPEWQARFNKLLEKPGTSPAQAAQAASSRPTATITPIGPAKIGSLPIAASSKAALEVRGNGWATVSLPNAPIKQKFANDNGRDVVTRKGTEVLFEDREFGSLPTVRLSKATHLAAGEPAVTPVEYDPVLVRFKKMENPFTQRRLEAFDHERVAQKNGAQMIDIIIRVSCMTKPIVKSVPRGRRPMRAATQYNKPKRNSLPNGPSAGGPRDRPRKPSGQGQTDRPNATPRTSTNAWMSSKSSTPASTPAHQETTWARRAAAPVH